MAVKNIMIVGVGGQGTLLTSRILGGCGLCKDLCKFDAIELIKEGE